jgi:streptomycin 6-kinase
MIEPELDAALRRWRLTMEAPPVRTPSGLVAMVRRGGERLVLKLPRAEDERGAWRVLAHYAGAGAVRVVEHAGDGAVLLERALPGDPLTARVLAGDDDGAMVVVCGVARRLHQRVPPRQRFARIEDWGGGFRRHRCAGRGGVAGHLLDQGEKLFAKLAESQAPRRLLHGDLHHDNILAAGDAGWLAIDPKGVIGDPAFEPASLLLNPPGLENRASLDRLLARRIDILSDTLGLEAERLRGWAEAKAVLSACWTIEDHGDAWQPAIALAERFAALRL